MIAAVISIDVAAAKNNNPYTPTPYIRRGGIIVNFEEDSICMAPSCMGTHGRVKDEVVSGLEAKVLLSVTPASYGGLELNGKAYRLALDPR